MALKDIVKGICGTSRCKYDVYTKEKTDELLENVYTKNETDNLLKTKANESNVYVKGDYADITATLTTDSESHTGSTKVAFPSGFNKNNCIVLGIMYKYDTSYPNNYISGLASSISKEVFVTLGKVDGTDDNNIYIQAKDDSTFGNRQFTVKVRLMKL